MCMYTVIHLLMLKLNILLLFFQYDPNITSWLHQFDFQSVSQTKLYFQICEDWFWINLALNSSWVVNNQKSPRPFRFNLNSSNERAWITWPTNYLPGTETHLILNFQRDIPGTWFLLKVAIFFHGLFDPKCYACLSKLHPARYLTSWVRSAKKSQRANQEFLIPVQCLWTSQRNVIYLREKYQWSCQWVSAKLERGTIG